MVGVVTILSPLRAAPDLAQTRRLLEDAHHGVAGAATRAKEALRSLPPTEAADALVRAMLGVALVLEARDAPLTEKRALAEAGFSEIDAAVALAPDDLEVRLIRAVNACQMPRALGRDAVADADFAWLLNRIESAADVSADLRRRVLFQSGACALKERQIAALSLLERALATPGPEPDDGSIKSMLALARREFTPPVDAHAAEEGQTQHHPP